MANADMGDFCALGKICNELAEQCVVNFFGRHAVLISVVNEA